MNKNGYIGNYRRIYKNHHGVIPKDKEGRVFDIHHKDGNKTNNDPCNLIALSINDHYELHYNQKEYRAAALIALRMNTPPETLNTLNRLAMEKSVKDGRHYWLSINGYDQISRNRELDKVK